MPALVLRHSALIVDENSKAKMKKLNIADYDIFKNQDELIRNFVKFQNRNEINLDEEKMKTEAMYRTISEKIVPLDPTLKSTVDAELQKSLNGLKNIEAKIQRSLKARHELEINQIIKLKQKLFPDNTLQERYENIFSYLYKYGFSFLEDLKIELNAFESEFALLEVN